jgi:protein-S-isoprenylcysteine O-methyltransferase Ste14
MNNKTKSLIFDFFQVGSIVFILLTGPVIASNIVFIVIQIIAVLILSEAAWEMRRIKYYRVPDIGKQKELVRSGIFKYIRNPMYLAQLLFFGILVLNSFSMDRFTVFLIFTLNFILKIQYEEVLLTTHFKDYGQYKKTSWRLIPFLY